MLAIVFTALFALYILGPDLFSRFVLSFTIPRRSVKLTRSEEVSRALIWAVVSIVPASFWAYRFGPLRHQLNEFSLRICFSGLYSEAFFSAHQALWFDNMSVAMWANLSLLWRVYLMTLLVSLMLTLITHQYGKLRKRLVHAPIRRNILASLVLPRVAPWHLLLSRILLTTDDLNIHLDVLTKQDGLYQGRLADKVLGSDGELLSITLADPRRFRRVEYLADKQKAAAEKREEAADKRNQDQPAPDSYWKRIPTNMFLIMGAEIQTINFRYVPRSVAALKKRRSPDNLEQVLSALSTAVRAAKDAKRKSAE